MVNLVIMLYVLCVWYFVIVCFLVLSSPCNVWFVLDLDCNDWQVVTDGWSGKLHRYQPLLIL